MTNKKTTLTAADAKRGIKAVNSLIDELAQRGRVLGNSLAPHNRKLRAAVEESFITLLIRRLLIATAIVKGPTFSAWMAEMLNMVDDAVKKLPPQSQSSALDAMQPDAGPDGKGH